jgi:hypothetical protein
MEDMTNEWPENPGTEEPLETQVLRLRAHCLRLQEEVNALTEACKEAAMAEREACATVLDSRAALWRERANNPTITVMGIRSLDLAALILSEGADMIRKRT